MKKEKLSTEVTYIKCPDKDCQLWYDNKIRCEYDCPQRNELKKLIKCWLCGEIIKLPINHSTMCRLEHQCFNGSSPFILEPGTIVITREDIT